GRRTIAPRPSTRRLDDAADRAYQKLRFLFSGKPVRVFMDVAVMGDLMAAAQDKLDRAGIGFQAPTGHKEGLAQPETLKSADDPRNCHLGSVSQHRRQGDTVRRRLPLIDVQQRFCIHVERERDGATSTVRPWNRILDHFPSHPASSDLLSADDHLDFVLYQVYAVSQR